MTADQLDVVFKISQIGLVAVALVAAVIALRQLREMRTTRLHEREAVKVNLLMELDRRWNSEEFRALHGRLGTISQSAREWSEAKDPSDWRTALASDPAARLDLVRHIERMQTTDGTMFVLVMNFVRMLHYVAMLRTSGVLSDDEVRSFCGSTLAVYCPVLPDYLVRFKARDPEGFNFADDVLALFRVMPANAPFFAYPTPMDGIPRA
jgi:hypothetical protein